MSSSRPEWRRHVWRHARNWDRVCDSHGIDWISSVWTDDVVGRRMNWIANYTICWNQLVIFRNAIWTSPNVFRSTQLVSFVWCGGSEFSRFHVAFPARVAFTFATWFPAVSYAHSQLHQHKTHTHTIESFVCQFKIVFQPFVGRKRTIVTFVTAHHIQWGAFHAIEFVAGTFLCVCVVFRYYDPPAFIRTTQ